MKKAIAVALALVLALSLLGCGEKTEKVNEQLSEDAVAALKAAIETLDSFLEYNLSTDEAKEKLNRIENSLTNDEYYDYLTKLRISVALSSVTSYGIKEGINEQYKAFGKSTEGNSMSGIRRSRDSLYDFLYR